MKIMIIEHYGNNGHHGTEVTESAVKAALPWNNLRKDVRELVQHCIHCIITRNEDRIPRLQQLS